MSTGLSYLIRTSEGLWPEGLATLSAGPDGQQSEDRVGLVTTARLRHWNSEAATDHVGTGVAMCPTNFT